MDNKEGAENTQHSLNVDNSNLFNKGQVPLDAI